MAGLKSWWPLLTVLLQSTCSAIESTYEFDQVCRQNNVRVLWLKDDDSLIIFGKTSSTSRYRECTIKFGPSSEAVNQTTKVTFQSYLGQDCRLFLLGQQAPSVNFESDVSLLFNMSCRSTIKKDMTFHADATNMVMLTHFRYNEEALNYNFRIRVSLTGHKVQLEPMSTVMIVSVVLLVLIVIIGALCIVYHCRKIKRWKRHHRYDDTSSLNSPEYSSQVPQSVRYASGTNLNTQPEQSVHSQVCILGSVTADGSCTVCHRHHDDFAHIVDINAAGEVCETTRSGHDMAQSNDRLHQEESSHACIVGSHDADGLCTICQRHHEDFAHIVDVGTDGNVQETVHSHQDSAPPGHADRRTDPHVNSTRPKQTRGQTSPAAPVTLAAGNRGQRNTSNRQPGARAQQAPHLNGHSRTGASHPDDDDYYDDQEDYDDDIDIVENDLIPPSYDLSPPSYDEAIHMPKPSVEASSDSGQHLDVSETDPLYQNLDSMTSDQR